MRIIEVPLYSFLELDENVKNKIIEDYRTSYCFYETPVIDGFREDMLAYGAEDVDVQWSGFYSQGDGACFTAVFDTVKLLSSLYKYDSDYDKLINRIKNGAYSVDISVVRCGQSNHYSHSNTVKICINCENWDDLTEYHQEQLIGLETYLTEWVRSECKSLYDSLEVYYEECTSENAITEDLDLMGDVYTSTGNQIAMRDIF
jgi:hypothetical protein